MTSSWLSPFLMEQSLLRQLVKEAKAGDRACFEQIVVLHERLVLRVAQRLLLNGEDAKDAAQEVFTKLHRTLGQFDTEKDLGPWLYRMTVNVCRDIQRLSRNEVALDSVLDAPSSALNPEQSAAAAEQYRLVLDALGQLSPREREAVVLRDLEGKSTQQVADLLGSSEGTIRSQLSTGRMKLKNHVLYQLRRAK